MTESATPGQREVRLAAIFAFIGAGLFLSVGLLLAVSATLMVNSVLWRYPGASLHRAGPDFWNILRLIGLSSGIHLLVGIVGVVVGVGLLRFRAWARDAALAWSLGSTLLFVIILAIPQSLIGVRVNPTGILIFLLFLVPVDVWWMGLFTRAEVIALFGAPSIKPSRRFELPAWLRENALGKSILIVGAVAVVGSAGAQVSYRRSPKRELERTRNALAGIHSWHYHTVRYFQGQAPETMDSDFVCPSFQHFSTSFVDARGETQTRESIHYFPNFYNYVGGQWLAANRQSGYPDPGIPECEHGPMGADQTSLPLDGVIADGSVTRGALRQVNGEPCRDYEIAMPMPNDPAERIFTFIICINEADHLPRGTRREIPHTPQETVSEFSHWNAMSEPDLPPEIPR